MLKICEKNTVLIVGSKASFHSRIETFLKNVYPTQNAETASAAIEMVQNNPNHIAVLIVDISNSFEMDPKDFLKQIKKAGYSEVVFCHKSFLSGADDVAAIVELTKLGAFDILQLPDFKELLDWVVARALAFFRMKSGIINRSVKEDYPLRVNAFFDLLRDRNQDGLSITESEINLFFPEQGNEKLPLETIQNKIKEAPVNELREINVLIADDEDNFRSAIDMMLEPYGYTTFEAYSGQQALDVTNSERIDIVLLDVALGDMTGDELVPIIKGNNPNTEIIMVTAFKDLELIVNTIKAGAFDYVVKGRQQELIPQKVSQALQKRHFERAIRQYLDTEAV